MLCAALWAALGLGLCGTRALAGVEADKPSPPEPRIKPFAAGPELVAKMTPYWLNAYTFTDEDGSEMSFLSFISVIYSIAFLQCAVYFA